MNGRASRALNDAALGRSLPCSRLQGRRLLVVGAGQRACDDPDALGNGRAISLLLAREGAGLACADRDVDAAAVTAALVRAEGGSASVIVADVAEAGSVAGMVSQAMSDLDGLDGIVVNAGMSLGRRLQEDTAREWDAVMAVNLRAPMLIAQAALPRMLSGGSIVFVSSLASVHPGGRSPAYEASKAGLAALVRATALEGQPQGIRVNAVAPGLIDTPMGRDASTRNAERATLPLPFGRQGTAWELAYAVLFLVSDEASYVNAQTLFVDGGLSQHVTLPVGAEISR
ncbi:MAG: SDR family oxidoreductase [Alphaproteobacteria bacterium]|nr:MAG: SDR family oxidoreductase [Alphaproteobacteria bacterium]